MFTGFKYNIPVQLNRTTVLVLRDYTLLSAFSSTICGRRLSSCLKSSNPHRELPLYLVSSHRLGDVDRWQIIRSAQECLKPLQVRYPSLPCNTAVIRVRSTKLLKLRILYRMQCRVSKEIDRPEVLLAINSSFYSHNRRPFVKHPLYKGFLSRGKYDFPFTWKGKRLTSICTSGLDLSQQFLVGHLLEVNESRDIACNSHIR